MVTKLHKADTAKHNDSPLTGSVKDSAQQIWQAGLGAFATAQAEGTRAFEALVKEGTSLQRKTQAAAEERISEATSRMSHMATDISSKASGHWDKLENIFEERVAKALNKLGVPSAKDVNALIARIDELNLAVQKMSGTSPAAAKKATPKRAAKPAAKPAARPVAKAATKTPAAAASPKPAKKAVRKPAAKRKSASQLAAT